MHTAGTTDIVEQGKMGKQVAKGAIESFWTARGKPEDLEEARRQRKEQGNAGSNTEIGKSSETVQDPVFSRTGRDMFDNRIRGGENPSSQQ